jgi:hypothetical protein
MPHSHAKAHAARERTSRAMRRSTRVLSTHVHASGAKADLTCEEVSKPVEILGTGAGAVER